MLVQALVDDQNIYSIKHFDLIGHLYASVSQGKVLKQFSGFEIHSIFDNQLTTALARQEHLEVAITSALVSIFLWTNPNLPKVCDDKYNPTVLLMPS